MVLWKVLQGLFLKSLLMDPMNICFVLLLLVSFFVQPTKPTTIATTQTSSQITVAGVVYCDVCSTNTFSRYSYFLPGVDVNIQCKFKANAPRTAEQIDFSVNRTTDKYGVYKLEIPNIEGIDCVEGQQIASMCQASLIGSSVPTCNVPGLRTTTSEITVKSKQNNLCIFSLNALNYRPIQRNTTLCGNQNQRQELDLEEEGSLNSSKTFLPYFPLNFPWPPIPQCPFPFPSSPLPPLQPFPPTPSLLHPPPPPLPAFNLTDPRTWFPYIPFFAPPPPPPPTPPAFNPWDPRTWAPYFPPYSPPGLQSQKP